MAVTAESEAAAAGGWADIKRATLGRTGVKIESFFTEWMFLNWW